MPAPIPATYPAKHVVTETEWNEQIRDTHREAPAVKAMVPNSIWYLETAGVSGILPPPDGPDKKILSSNGGAPYWDTPPPTIPPDNSVTEQKIAFNNSPAADEVASWTGTQLQWRLARLKLELLDSDTSASNGNVFSESTSVGQWDKYAFLFVRMDYVTGNTRYMIQSPMLCFMNVQNVSAAPATNDIYSRWKFDDGLLNGSGIIRVDRDANRIHLSVTQNNASVARFLRVSLFGIRDRVAGAGF